MLYVLDIYVSKLLLKLAGFCDSKRHYTVKVILINFATKCFKNYNFISQPSPKLMHARFNTALLKILFAYVSLKLSHLLTPIQVQSHHFLPLLFSQIEPSSSEKPASRNKKKVNYNLDHMFPHTDQRHTYQYFLALFVVLFSQTTDTHLLMLRSVTEANETCEFYHIKGWSYIYSLASLKLRQEKLNNYI